EDAAGEVGEGPPATASSADEAAEGAGEGCEPGGADAHVDGAVSSEEGERAVRGGGVGAGLHRHLSLAGQVREVVRGNPGIDVDTDARGTPLDQVLNLLRANPGVDAGADVDDAVLAQLVE